MDPNQSNTDTWLDKVQKLLAKAEDANVTDAERQAYSAKAEELMLKYSIDEAMLQVKQNGQADTIETKVLVILNPYAIVKATLIHSICLFFGCRAVRTQGWQYNSDTRSKTRINKVTLVGYSRDLAMVDMLYTSLVIQMHTAILATPIPQYEHGKTFRAALTIGFTEVVCQRLHSIRNKAKADKEVETPGTALVLVKRDQLVEMRRNEIFPHLVPGRGATAQSSTGRGIGREYGQRADLGQSRLGPNTRAIGQS